jgi:hypothetical protein
VDAGSLVGGGAGCGSPFRAGREERDVCEPEGMAGDGQRDAPLHRSRSLVGQGRRGSRSRGSAQLSPKVQAAAVKNPRSHATGVLLRVQGVDSAVFVCAMSRNNAW